MNKCSVIEILLLTFLFVLKAIASFNKNSKRKNEKTNLCEYFVQTVNI